MNSKKWPKASKKDQLAVKRLLDNVDWDKFWVDVMEKCRPQLEAYEQARIRSRMQVHVFR